MVSNLTSNAIKKIERKIIGKGAVRAGKGLKLFISNEDMDDIINTKKPLEHSSLLFVGVTESVKHKKKNSNKRLISWSLASPFRRFISSASNFFNSKRCRWKRS